MKPASTCPRCGHAKSRTNPNLYCYACDDVVRQAEAERAAARILKPEISLEDMGPVVQALADLLLEHEHGGWVTREHVEARLGDDLQRRTLHKAVLKLRSAGWRIRARSGAAGGCYAIG